MSVQAELITSLKTLPCFDEITATSLIAEGLSQTAIKVSTNKGIFFAKKLFPDTANTEVYCSKLCSNSAKTYSSQNTSIGQLTPNVLYHDSHWLITPYVSGTTLSQYQIPNNCKIDTALELMVQLHQLPITRDNTAISSLDTMRSFSELWTAPAPFLLRHHAVLHKLCKSLTERINRLLYSAEISNVLCHGDINFTNILIDNDNQPWLIDFECAHIAPAEFDLAMFIAVNSLSRDRVKAIMANYHMLAPNSHTNHQLLSYYLLYSYLINGLWYFHNIEELDLTCPLNELGKVQWSAFDEFAKQLGIETTKLSSLIS